MHNNSKIFILLLKYIYIYNIYMYFKYTLFSNTEQMLKVILK